MTCLRPQSWDQNHLSFSASPEHLLLSSCFVDLCALGLLQHALIRHLLDYRHPGESWRQRGKYLRCGPCGLCELVQRVDGMRVVAQERNRKQFRVASAQALKGDRERQAGVAGVGVAWEGLVGKPHNKMRAVECHRGPNLGGCHGQDFFTERPLWLQRGEWVHRGQGWIPHGGHSGGGAGSFEERRGWFGKYASVRIHPSLPGV